MDAISHGNRRYKIYYGLTQGPEGYGFRQLYAALQAHLPYILVAVPSLSEIDADCDPVVIGTVATNPLLARLVEQGLLCAPTKPQSYHLYVGKSPFNPDRDAIFLLGADGPGALYAVRDLEHDYLDVRRYENAYWVTRPDPLSHPLPEFKKESAPAIPDRGIWCWGHTVYDYRAFIDHMTFFKLNTLILWNDYAPINAKEVVGLRP